MSARIVSCFLAPFAVWLLLSCESNAESWQVIERRMPSALMSVWGTSAADVYVVGADARDGRGPAVHHFDGESWARLETGQSGNLWWVFGFPEGPIYMGGDGGVILSYRDGVFTRMATPGSGTVFGIWGSSEDDVWAVGGSPGGSNGAFAWRLRGGTWEAAAGFPAALAGTHAMWKVYGRGGDDVWLVGTSGKVIRWDGSSLTESTTGGESLFTVHADSARFGAVGGFGTGKILENDGSGWRDASPPGAPAFTGIWMAGGRGYAVGQQGAVYVRDAKGWAPVETGLVLDETLHSIWIDPVGGVWAVGGQVLTLPLIDGVVLYRGEQPPGGLL